MQTHWIYLGIAIVAEVFATSALKLSDGFTRLPATLAVLLGYGISFYLLSLSLRSVPIGIAYAIWSGAGLLLISLVGWLVCRQSIDLPGLLGMALIAAGVLTICLFSTSVGH